MHQADAVVFAIGITGVGLARSRDSLVSGTLRSDESCLYIQALAYVCDVVE